MEFSQYSGEARQYTRPTCVDPLLYGALGLSGEAGEVTEKIKRIVRQSQNAALLEFTDEERHNVLLELGDCLWYIDLMARALGYNLEQVAQDNLGKLSKRCSTGTIYGVGDHREDAQC